MTVTTCQKVIEILEQNLQIPGVNVSRDGEELKLSGAFLGRIWPTQHLPTGVAVKCAMKYDATVKKAISEALSGIEIKIAPPQTRTAPRVKNAQKGGWFYGAADEESF